MEPSSTGSLTGLCGIHQSLDEWKALGSGYLQISVVMGSGTLFQGKDELKPARKSWKSPWPTALDLRLLANGGKARAMRKRWLRRRGPSTPLAFPTCGDDSASVRDLVKGLDMLRVEMDEEYLLSGDAGKLPIQVKKTGRRR